MKSIIHILSKNPDLCECKTRLRDFLSNKERIYLSKTMLTMLCYEMNKTSIQAICIFIRVIKESSQKVITKI